MFQRIIDVLLPILFKINSADIGFPLDELPEYNYNLSLEVFKIGLLLFIVEKRDPWRSNHKNFENIVFSIYIFLVFNLVLDLTFVICVTNCATNT